MKDKIYISHKFYDAGRTVVNHSHSQYEITYLFRGTRKYFVKDNIFVAREKNFILMDKNVMHKTTFCDDDSYERFSVYFYDEYLDRIFGNKANEISSMFAEPLFNVPAKSVKQVETLMRNIEKEYEDNGEYSEMLVEKYLMELLIYIARARTFISRNNKGISEEKGSFMESVTKYVIERYHTPITLTEIAEYMHLSPSWFSAKFKSMAGIGFREYLVRVRVQKACEMLISTSDSIMDIAFACGFNDSNYFGDAFKKLIGMSPRNYRKTVSDD